MSLKNRVEEITKNVEETRKNSLLSPVAPRVMGVTKGQGREAITEAIGAGVTCFGENRVQEAYDKWPDIKKNHPNITLHLIGPLQTNKVKQALELFDVIETLDRTKLAEEIKRVLGIGFGGVGGETLNPKPQTRLYIQINTGEEPQKTGIFPKESDDFIRYCRDDLKLPVVGLMCIPPMEDVPAPHFSLLREIAKRNHLQELSMGMSGDYEAAIRMGSTQIRLGTVLFGKRIS